MSNYMISCENSCYFRCIRTLKSNDYGPYMPGHRTAITSRVSVEDTGVMYASSHTGLRRRCTRSRKSGVSRPTEVNQGSLDPVKVVHMIF